MKPNILVLLVEDEPMILHLISETLQDAGFAVTTSMNGEEAVQMLQDKGGDYRALVTDIRLGRSRMLGWDVARRARELNPDLAVIYISGDSGHEWQTKGVAGSVLIPKPFAPAEIVTAVAKLINAASLSQVADAG